MGDLTWSLFTMPRSKNCLGRVFVGNLHTAVVAERRQIQIRTTPSQVNPMRLIDQRWVLFEKMCNHIRFRVNFLQLATVDAPIRNMRRLWESVSDNLRNEGAAERRRSNQTAEVVNPDDNLKAEGADGKHRVGWHWLPAAATPILWKITKLCYS